MSTKYKRKDHLYEKAKSDGYRSRAAYKLKELNQRFHLFSRGSRVLELGAWPGSWTQVAAEIVGESGRVAGIDLTEIDPLESGNVTLITGDAADPQVLQRALDALGGRCTAVISDMSPKLSGIREADQAGSVACAEAALAAAKKGLETGGSIVVKLFKGSDTDQFVKTVRPLFNKLARAELDATRKTSNEYYLVGLGFRG